MNQPIDDGRDVSDSAPPTGEPNGGGSIGVSLSGGGYRAAAFSAGALLYLTEGGYDTRISTVVSVSGGSITNGFRSTQRRAGSASFTLDTASPLLHMIANRSAISGRALLRILAFVFGLCMVVLVGLAAVANAGHGVSIAVFVGGLLGIVVIVLVLLAWYGLGPEIVSTLNPALRALYMVEAAGVEELGARRKFSLTGTHDRMIGDLLTDETTVFCATGLASGTPVYLANQFLATTCVDPVNPRFPMFNAFGNAIELTLINAVVTSALFPAVFKPARYNTRKLGFPLGAKAPEHLELTDGGVYDNLGASFFRAVARAETSTQSTDPVPAAISVEYPGLPDPDMYVIVDAGDAPTHAKPPCRMRWFGYFIGAQRAVSIIHQLNTAARSREAQELVDRKRGIYVSLNDNPFRVAERCPEGKRERILALLASIDRDSDGLASQWWGPVAEAESSRISTGMKKLRPNAAASLVLKGFVLLATRDIAELDAPQPRVPSFDVLVQACS